MNYSVLLHIFAEKSQNEIRQGKEKSATVAKSDRIYTGRV